MTLFLARALMSVADACLGPERGEWSAAMRVEFIAAIEDKRPVIFALGCLMASLRELASVGEGKLVIVNYGLALGLLIPMAVRQFGQANSLFVFSREGLLTADAAHNPYLVWSQNSAARVLLLLWLLLGIAHLSLAWMLVEGNRSRVLKLGALIAATAITLVLFAGMLMFDLSPLISQLPDLGLELAAIFATARWHAYLTMRATGVSLP